MRSAPLPNGWAPPSQRAIVVGLPELRSAPGGGLHIEPNVVIDTQGQAITRPPLGHATAAEVPPPSPVERWAQRLNLVPSDAELLAPPLAEPLPPSMEYFGPPIEALPVHGANGPVAQPIFGRVLKRMHHDDCDCCDDEEGFFSRLLPEYGVEEGGIGRDRLAVAPFVIDVAQPLNNFRLRVDLVEEFRVPDRAEYMWSKPGRGPLPERSVSYQDLRFLMETGGPKFSIGTEIPIRVLDPEINGNTAGLSDLNLTTKTVMFEGDAWQITQIFRSYFNTGAPRKGLGSGHISLEPGLLARYRASDTLHWHGAIQYWFPLGADPVHAGQVLNYGIGYSHLLYDSDTFAIIDTFELMAWSILDGQKLDPVTFQPIEIDGEAVIHAYPGVRFVRDTGGDFGLIECGISGTVGMGNSHWYDSLIRMDFRVSY